MGVEAGAGVGAGQAADAEGEAGVPVGATGSAVWIDNTAKVITPAIEVIRVEARAAGATSGG